MFRNKVIKNASWIIACKIVQSILGLIISMLTARYLGPSNFGLINYAMSITTFFVPIMQIGFNSIIVQEIINNPEKEGETLGTALVMNTCSGLLSILGVLAFTMIANAGETETIIVCILYSFSLIAQALEMVQYWFQAKLLSKYSSIVSLIAYFIISAYKIFLLITAKSVHWFAVSYAIDYAMIALGLISIYYKIGSQKFSFSIKTAKHMFNKGKYYIVSGMMVTIFAQTDRIMLKLMLDDAATGYYSAAVTCAGMTSFVFVAIIDSMRPFILEGKNINQDIFEYRVKQLYSIVIFLALAESIVISIFADVFVQILYGEHYFASVGILRIVVWYTTFSFYGGAKDVWILAENKYKYLVWLNFSGALANIILNLILIPQLGAEGAAIASLVTQFFTNIIMGFVIKALRQNNILLLQSLNPKFIIEFLRSFKNLRRKIP